MHHVAGAEPVAEHKAGPNVTIQACSTGPTQPGNCQEFIIDLIILLAACTIHMQAYEFTDGAIAKALIARHGDLKDIVVIVDKSQRTERYSIVPNLVRAGIIVAVGSRAEDRAQQGHPDRPDRRQPRRRNRQPQLHDLGREPERGERLVIRNDTDLARQFETYFEARYRQSEPW